MKSEATILLDVQSKTFYRSESQIKNETSLVFGEAWMTNIYNLGHNNGLEFMRTIIHVAIPDIQNIKIGYCQSSST